MRVAILTELYPPHLGGQDIRYAELAQALIQVGHSVDVFCVRHAKDVPSAELANGVPIRRFPLSPGYEKPVFKPLKRAFWPMLLYSLWVRFRVKPDDYDLFIYGHWPLAHLMLASRKARRKALMDWCEIRDGKVFEFIQSRFPKLAAANAAVSDAVAQHLEQVSGRPVACMVSGVWLSQYRTRSYEERDGLLYAGRITEHKNLPLLFEAYEILKNRGYTGKLTVIGDGPLMPQTVEMKQNSRYAGDIRILGVVDEETKAELFSRAHVLVLPSKREGFPRVVAEAMASGLPVATPDYPVNGTREVVRQYDIGVVSEPTAVSLADGIEQVLAGWQQYSENGYRSRRDLSWEGVVDVLEDVARKMGVTVSPQVPAVASSKAS